MLCYVISVLCVILYDGYGKAFKNKWWINRFDIFYLKRTLIPKPFMQELTKSTSTSTLFIKNGFYNRLARKIAIANPGGPVKRKN